MLERQGQARCKKARIIAQLELRSPLLSVEPSGSVWSHWNRGVRQSKRFYLLSSLKGPKRQKGVALGAHYVRLRSSSHASIETDVAGTASRHLAHLQHAPNQSTSGTI